MFSFVVIGYFDEFPFQHSTEVHWTYRLIFVGAGGSDKRDRSSCIQWASKFDDGSVEKRSLLSSDRNNGNSTTKTVQWKKY